MHSPPSQEIVARFFKALQYLIDIGEVKSRNWFSNEYGIIQNHFWRSEYNHASQIFQIAWLSILIVEYGISAGWLMTGRGEMTGSNMR